MFQRSAAALLFFGLRTGWLVHLHRNFPCCYDWARRHPGGRSLDTVHIWYELHLGIATGSGRFEKVEISYICISLCASYLHDDY
jgi:hypothetical protein